MMVLITGASGLIGGRLIQHLLKSPGVQIRAGSRRERTWPVGVEGYIIDLARPESLDDACRGVDTIVHLAAMPERLCRIDPRAALLVNAGGAFAMASAAASAGVSRFVQLSTYKVYGNTPTGTINEDTHTEPRSHYAITHRMAEDYVRWQHPNSIVFRLANAFGAPVDADVDCWDIIVNDMCRQVILHRQISIRSSGHGWRNFVPIDDVIAGICAGVDQLSAGTYHLGAMHSTQLIGIAEHVARVCGDTFGYTPSVHVGYASNDLPDVPLDYRIDKLAVAGFTPKASVDDEIRRTLLAAQQMFPQSSH
jgi:UDP-glucose 4-epimerase